MKHIEYYSFSKQEWNALNRLLESIWTSAGLDLRIMLDSANYDAESRKEAELRLRETIGISQSISAWLVFSCTAKFPRNDFKSALRKIADRLRKYGVDIDTQLREAGYEPENFTRTGEYSVVISSPEVTYVHQSGHTKEKAEQIAKLLNENFDQMDGPVEAIVMVDSEARKYKKYHKT